MWTINKSLRRALVAGLALVAVSFNPAPAFSDQESLRYDPREHPFYRESVVDLALTMWAEAFSEGDHGMRLVGHVVLNRVRAGTWGDSVYHVVRARSQFAVWRSRGGRAVRQLALYERGQITPDIARALAVAEALLLEEIIGSRRDETRGATHFLGRHEHDGQPWAARKRTTLIHGRHRFYADHAERTSHERQSRTQRSGRIQQAHR